MVFIDLPVNSDLYYSERVDWTSDKQSKSGNQTGYFPLISMIFASTAIAVYIKMSMADL